MREFSSQINDLLDQDLVIPIMFVELEFDTGTIRVHNDLGEIDALGETWLGTGHLGSVEEITEAEDGSPRGLKMQLSGLDIALPSTQTFLNEALTQTYDDRDCVVFLGFRNVTTGSLVSDPFEIFAGSIDQMNILDADETATIEVEIESESIRDQRSSERRWSDAQQQTDYPGDLGFSFLSQMIDQRLKWGGKRASLGTVMREMK